MLHRRFWLGPIVSLLFFGLLFWRIDLSGTWRILQEANYLFMLPGVVIYFISVVFRTLRWQVLLLPLRRISARRLFPVVVVGYMANNLLPRPLGEVVRSYYVGRREGVSTSAALATVAVERVFDGVTLLFFLVAVLVFLPVTGSIQGLVKEVGILWTVLAVAIAVAFVLILGLLTLVAHRPLWALRSVATVTRRLPGRVGAQVTEIAGLFVTGLGVLRNPRRLAALSLLCLPVWLMEAAMYYVIGFSFDMSSALGGPAMMAAAMLAVTATSNLATSLPGSQGGIGPFEFFGAATLFVLGVEKEIAVAYAVALHVALLSPVTLLGLLYLWLGRDSLVRLVRMREEHAPSKLGNARIEVSTKPEETP